MKEEEKEISIKPEDELLNTASYDVTSYSVTSYSVASYSAKSYDV